MSWRYLINNMHIDVPVDEFFFVWIKAASSEITFYRDFRKKKESRLIFLSYQKVVLYKRKYCDKTRNTRFFVYHYLVDDKNV